MSGLTPDGAFASGVAVTVTVAVIVGSGLIDGRLLHPAKSNRGSRKVLFMGVLYLLKKNSVRALTAGDRMTTAAAALIKPKARLTT
jgi:hypothetical protein